ncbi:MAG: zinc-dependent alcohol dehydrogenase [Zhaonellaceae bacterium]|jgi:L-iditol 2-dehydrogenase
MKAVRKYGEGVKEWHLVDAPEPTPGPGEVKIKVAYTGICGSDLHMYLGNPEGPPDLIPGHEFSGTVVEVGPGVTEVKVGDRVTAEHTLEVCGICQHCRDGNYQRCAKRVSLGFNKHGSFAEYAIATAKYVHILPENVSLEEGALTEPLACALHAIELIEPVAGDKTLVIGPGPIGLLTALCLKAYNCQVDIIGTEQDKMRLEKAKEIGINVITSFDDASYDVVAECSGSQGGVGSALKAVRKGGKVIQVGICTKPIMVDFDNLIFKELTIKGTFCHHYPTWEKALKFEEMGILDVKPIISETLPIEKWEEAMEKLINKEGLKILLKM